MAAAAIPALVTGAAGLIGAKQQKKAVERASREQAAAARAAQARLAPYQEQGEFATQQIRTGLETGTLGGSFVPGDLAADPGYQFRLAEAEKAQDRLQAARGGLYSGQALKERERLAQGLAASEYENAYNRWQQEQQERYRMLSGQQQTGYGAATGGVGIDIPLGQQEAQATMARREAQDVGTAMALGSGLEAGLDIYGRTPWGRREETGLFPWQTSQQQTTGFGAGGTQPIVPSRFVSY